MIWPLNSRDTIHETLRDEVLVIHLKLGRYYTLRESGAFLYRELERSTPEESLAALLSQRYGIQVPAAEVDLREFLQELRTNELVLEPVENHPPGGSPLTEPAGVDYVRPTLTVHSDMEALLLLDPVHDAGPTGWPETTA